MAGVRLRSGNTKKVKSGYFGVRWNPWCNKWVVAIRNKDKVRYLGLFVDVVEAAHHYDKHARKLNKKLLNFPDRK